jgi:DNA-binding MarR family transcriptional regulator
MMRWIIMKSARLDESLSFLIYRVHIRGLAQLRRVLQNEGFQDITPEQAALMARIREREGMNQSQLGNVTLKDRPNITRIMRLLKKKGFIESRSDRENQRARHLFLTKSGNEVLDQITPLVAKVWRSRVEGLHPEEINMVRTILKRISENIEKDLGNS